MGFGAGSSCLPIENIVMDRIRELGGQANRNGWPDLILKTPSGKIIALELKSDTDSIRDSQQVNHDLLRQAGIEVKIMTYTEAFWHDWTLE